MARKGFVDADPFVGVRHPGVESLVAAASERPEDPASGTVFRPLYEVVADETTYVTREVTGDRVDEEVAALVHDISTAGLQYARSLRNLEDIVEALRHVGRFDVVRLRLPAALWLLDRRQEAIDFLDRQIEGEGASNVAPNVELAAFRDRLARSENSSP